MAEEILVRTAKETSDVISHKINARASEEIFRKSQTENIEV